MALRAVVVMSLRKAEEANFQANTTEADVFGVKFIGLHGTVGLL